MSDFFADPTVQASAAVLILCVPIAAGFYLVSSFRDYTAEDMGNADDALANLEEMHRKGDISDEEFRTIQATTHQQPAETNVNDPSLHGEGSTKT